MYPILLSRFVAKPANTGGVSFLSMINHLLTSKYIMVSRSKLIQQRFRLIMVIKNFLIYLSKEYQHHGRAKSQTS